MANTRSFNVDLAAVMEALAPKTPAPAGRRVLTEAPEDMPGAAPAKAPQLQTGLVQAPKSPLTNANVERAAKLLYDDWNTRMSEVYGDYYSTRLGSEKVVRRTYANLGPARQAWHEIVKALYGAGVLVARDLLLQLGTEGSIPTNDDKVLAVQTIVSVINTKLQSPEVFGKVKMNRIEAKQPLSLRDKRRGKPFMDAVWRVKSAIRAKQVAIDNKRIEADARARGVSDVDYTNSGVEPVVDKYMPAKYERY